MYSPRLVAGSCAHGVSGKKAADGKEKCPHFHPPNDAASSWHSTPKKQKDARKEITVTLFTSISVDYRLTQGSVLIHYVKLCIW